MKSIKCVKFGIVILACIGMLVSAAGYMLMLCAIPILTGVECLKFNDTGVARRTIVLNSIKSTAIVLLISLVWYLIFNHGETDRLFNIIDNGLALNLLVRGVTFTLFFAALNAAPLLFLISSSTVSSIGIKVVNFMIMYLLIIIVLAATYVCAMIYPNVLYLDIFYLLFTISVFTTLYKIYMKIDL